MRYFYFSMAFLFTGVVAGYLFGGLYAVYFILILALLEISISFDNAVVNAKVLAGMDQKWRERFIFYGIPIAVFGVRFLLPIIIIAVASGESIVAVVNLAINEPEKYKEMLEDVMHMIYAFGGAFLFMVFLEFYFDHDRSVAWLTLLESNKLTRYFGNIPTIELVIAISIGICLTYFTHDYQVSIAFFIGVLIYSVINAINDKLAHQGMKSGIVGFLYLEMLDASFSLDGVIGAFAISTNIFVIMTGLAIGAFYVRSLTIFMVEQGTLNQYRYLEHGAHYAIFVLAIIMFLEIFIHISEVVAGSVGIFIIGAAFLHSYLQNQREQREHL